MDVVTTGDKLSKHVNFRSMEGVVAGAVAVCCVGVGVGGAASGSGGLASGSKNAWTLRLTLASGWPSARSNRPAPTFAFMLAGMLFRGCEELISANQAVRNDDAPDEELAKARHLHRGRREAGEVEARRKAEERRTNIWGLFCRDYAHI
jgi:hypothetical protein